MACRARPGSAQLREDLLDRRVEVVRDLVDEADPECRRRVEALARDEVAPGGAIPDLAERKRRDDGGDDPELHLGEREHGQLLGEHVVAARD